jgi:hypothetical protein
VPGWVVVATTASAPPVEKREMRERT